jgi:hypothetical protein
MSNTAVIQKIDSWPEPQKSIGHLVRNILLGQYPELEESIKWGNPTFSGSSNLCSLICHNDHLNMQWFKGSELDDPEQVLEGTGKSMRHQKLLSVGDIDEDIIIDFLEQSLSL